MTPLVTGAHDAMSDERPTPNTSNSDANATSVGGNVTTGRDFVGRDLTVHGDQVQGDKITAGDRGVAAKQIVSSTLVTGDYATINYPRIDLTDVRNQRNHATMRQLVRKFWIDGVLKSSLYNEVLIRLNLTEQPKAVDNRPWDLILQQPGKPNYEIPPGTPIIDVFDQMNQRLLILGEPGSGKTTMLLELADALLKRAETDPTHPTLVVFNLSSWAEQRQPLAEWIVDELRTKYNIPRKVAQRWVEDDELLLLLDGLDEVQQDYRNACIVAINSFRQEHLVPIAVCSRVNEYEDLAVQLKLQGAVLVQPLTLAQIEEYLGKVGAERSALRLVLQRETELRKMATSPLLLSIMVIAYHDLQVEDIRLNDSTHGWRQDVLNTYVKRMFFHRGYRHSYPIQKTIRWLAWLAANIFQFNRTVFLIEQLQPYWLRVGSLDWVYRLTAGLSIGLSLGLTVGLIAGLIAGLTAGLIAGLTAGLITGLITGLTVKVKKIVLVEQLEFSKKALIAGLVIGLSGWLITWFSNWHIILILILLTAILRKLFSNTQKLSELSETTQREQFPRRAKVNMSIILFFYFTVWLVDLVAPTESDFDEDLSKPLQTTYPNQGIGQPIRNLFMFLLISGTTPAFISWLVNNEPDSIIVGLSIGLSVGVFRFGGVACIKHFILRTLLWRHNYAPLNYTRFLDYCHARLFLRKVGGGYIFIHRTLLEHFASLTDDDIKRLAAEVEASRS
jgi:hypothetical protein